MCVTVYLEWVGECRQEFESAQQSYVIQWTRKVSCLISFINWTDTQANKGHWIRHTRKQRVWACSYQSSRPAHQLHHPSIFVPHCSLSLLRSVESCRPQSLQRWRKSGPKPRRPGLLSLQQPGKKMILIYYFSQKTTNLPQGRNLSLRQAEQLEKGTRSPKVPFSQEQSDQIRIQDMVFFVRFWKTKIVLWDYLTWGVIRNDPHEETTQNRLKA